MAEFSMLDFRWNWKNQIEKFLHWINCVDSKILYSLLWQIECCENNQIYSTSVVTAAQFIKCINHLIKFQMENF